METVKEKDGVFYYINLWHKKYGCKFSTVIGCEWIYNDDELNTFQKWLDRKMGA